MLSGNLASDVRQLPATDWSHGNTPPRWLHPLLSVTGLGWHVFRCVPWWVLGLVTAMWYQDRHVHHYLLGGKSGKSICWGFVGTPEVWMCNYSVISSLVVHLFVFFFSHLAAFYWVPILGWLLGLLHWIGHAHCSPGAQSLVGEMEEMWILYIIQS